MRRIDSMAKKLDENVEEQSKSKRMQEELTKQRDTFKKLVDEINDKYGGLTAVQE